MALVLLIILVCQCGCFSSLPAYGSFIIELAPDAVIPEHTDAIHVHEIGETTKAYELVLGGEALDLSELQEAWEGGIESVFPYRAEGEEVEAVSYRDALLLPITALSQSHA